MLQESSKKMDWKISKGINHPTLKVCFIFLSQSVSYSYKHSSVRAVVPDVDDQAIPVNTLRMWILGFTFTMLGSGINQFFSLRYPSVHIVALVAQLLAFPFGVALAKLIPLYTINLGPLGKWCINPDRHFNIKEHTVITIMSNVSFGFGAADSTNTIQAVKAFYNFDVKPGFYVLIVLCCQLLGFGVAGLSAPCKFSFLESFSLSKALGGQCLKKSQTSIVKSF
jgi:hypothetical protein